MKFFDILLFIHIFSAILGMGPGFVMIYIVTKSKTMTELRHAYAIRNRIHIFVMVGGTLLLITGVWMGILRPYLFQQIWYTSSLILFLIALAAGPMLLSPRSKPIKQLLRDYDGGETIPKEYDMLSAKLFFYERITNVIFLIIIALMILKPF